MKKYEGIVPDVFLDIVTWLTDRFVEGDERMSKHERRLDKLEAKAKKVAEE